MADEGQGTQQGNQGDVSQGQSLGWRAALPDEFKEHEFVKTFQKPGDFVKSALEIKTERDGLKTKMGNAIFKPGEKATDEEKTNYLNALGRPAKPEDYEFPKLEEIHSDERMVKWASNLFWNLGLTKEQAHGIGVEWEEFLKGIITQEEKLAQDDLKKLGENFRKEFGSEQEYNAAVEITRRYWEKVTGTKFDDYCMVTGTPDMVLMKFIYENAKKTGEDFSPPGGRTGGGASEIGIIYDKSPKPPSQEVR